MRCWLWTTVAIAMAGCDDAAQQVTPTECDPIADEGCPSDERCRVVAGGGTACLAPEAPEAECVAGSCPAGESCLRVEGWLGCRTICRAEDGEGCPGACVYRVGETSPWGACADTCTLGACADGLTCAPVPVWDRPVCVRAGEAAEGDDCRNAPCRAGLACLRLEEVPRCLPVCDPEGGDVCPGRCTGRISGVEGLNYCVGAR